MVAAKRQNIIQSEDREKDAHNDAESAGYRGHDAYTFKWSDLLLCHLYSRANASLHSFLIPRAE